VPTENKKTAINIPIDVNVNLILLIVDI